MKKMLLILILTPYVAYPMNGLARDSAIFAGTLGMLLFKLYTQNPIAFQKMLKDHEQNNDDKQQNEPFIKSKI